MFQSCFGKEKLHNGQSPCNCCFPLELNLRLWHPTRNPVSSAIDNIQESELQNSNSNLAEITLPVSLNYNSKPGYIGLLDTSFSGNSPYNKEPLNLDRLLSEEESMAAQVVDLQNLTAVLQALQGILQPSEAVNANNVIMNL